MDIDWDVFVYDSEGNQVAVAASLHNPEEAVLVDPVPGEYTVLVNNYAGGSEAWVLTCTDLRTGRIKGTREVIVDRGKVARVGRICDQPRAVVQ